MLTAPTLQDIAEATRQHLGEAEHHRLWCVMRESVANRFRRVEFRGWLIGWGEAVVALRHLEHRTDVNIHLTVDGRIITTLNVTPGTVRPFTGSPPEDWAMYLGDHGSLEDLEGWLASLEQVVGAELAPRAAADALSRARACLDRIERGVARDETARRERLDLLGSSRW